MNSAQAKIVEQITKQGMRGIPKTADCTIVDEARWPIHDKLFSHPELEDVSAADLTDESDNVIAINGWSL